MKSDIYDDGTQAALTLALLVQDMNTIEQLYTLNQVFWATQDFWTSSGLITASSLLRVLNTIDWNTEASLNYANHQYNVLARDLSQDRSSIIFEALGNVGIRGCKRNGGACFGLYRMANETAVLGSCFQHFSVGLDSTTDTHKDRQRHDG